ncbi:MAG: hypothetical protein KBH06_12180 [Spirochaetes bacterium]|nr:hypothetical protein [Spirochaetota bacterium]
MMKKILAFLLILFVLFGNNIDGSEDKIDDIIKYKHNKILDELFDEIVVVDNKRNKKSVKEFEELVYNFALNLKVDTEKKMRIPIISDDMKIALRELRKNKSQVLEVSLVLILLKIYYNHLITCNQSYDLRNNPDLYGINPILEPIVYEFNYIAKYWDPDDHIEYISSEIIMDYVQKNKRLLSNKHIKEYYNKLLKIY